MRCWDREVEPGDRLVEQQQVRLGGERLGDEHPLLLPAGQVAERLADERGRHPCARRPARSPARSSARSRPSRPRSPYRPIRSTSPTLSGIQRCCVWCWATNDTRVPARSATLTRRRLQQPGEHVEQRALAAAVGPDERHRLPGRDRERARGERDRGAVVDAHVRGDHRRRRRSTGSMLAARLLMGAMPTRIVLRMLLSLGLAVGWRCSRGGAAVRPAGRRRRPAGRRRHDVDLGRHRRPRRLRRRFDVQTLIPVGGDPHSYEPSMQDRDTLERRRARRRQRGRPRSAAARHARGGRRRRHGGVRGGRARHDTPDGRRGEDARRRQPTKAPTRTSGSTRPS